MKEYYIVDIERSKPTNKIHFWKANRRGYTININEAGLYTKQEAYKIAADDIEGNTIPVHMLAMYSKSLQDIVSERILK